MPFLISNVIVLSSNLSIPARFTYSVLRAFGSTGAAPVAMFCGMGKGLAIEIHDKTDIIKSVDVAQLKHLRENLKPQLSGSFRIRFLPLNTRVMARILIFKLFYCL